jgi:hypothetical protein
MHGTIKRVDSPETVAKRRLTIAWDRAERAEIMGSLKPAPAWRPNLAESERLLRLATGYRPPTHAEIAAMIGVRAETFSTWFERLRGALTARPHAIECLKHLRDLRTARTRPPPIMPKDILRRADALERARALVARMPGGWPNPPVAWTPELDPPGCHDEDGRVARGKHGANKRR